jgi:hypothetical protein
MHASDQLPEVIVKINGLKRQYKRQQKEIKTVVTKRRATERKEENKRTDAEAS